MDRVLSLGTDCGETTMKTELLGVGSGVYLLVIFLIILFMKYATKHDRHHEDDDV